MKGMESAYVIALIFTFVLGIGSLVVFYDDFVSGRNRAYNFQQISNFLGVPNEYVEDIISSKDFTGLISLVSTINEPSVKGFIVENTGTLPLSGFLVKAGGLDYEPYAAPSMLLPGSRGAIIVDSNVWQRILDTKSATIFTDQNVRITLFLNR